jgi:hypothetical protein
MLTRDKRTNQSIGRIHESIVIERHRKRRDELTLVSEIVSQVIQVFHGQYRQVLQRGYIFRTGPQVVLDPVVGLCVLAIRKGERGSFDQPPSTTEWIHVCG